MMTDEQLAKLKECCERCPRYGVAATRVTQLITRLEAAEAVCAVADNINSSYAGPLAAEQLAAWRRARGVEP